MDFPRLTTWLKTAPGYDPTIPQVLGHDSQGRLVWHPAAVSVERPEPKKPGKKSGDTFP